MPTRNGTFGVTDDICEERRCAIRREIATAVDHERELRESETEMRDQARSDQAKIYEARLMDLNHNLRITLEDRKTYFTKESHEAFAVEFRRFRDEVKTFQTMVATWGAAGIFALGLLQAFLHFYLK
jgi:hypothetical protein